MTVSSDNLMLCAAICSWNCTTNSYAY